MQKVSHALFVIVPILLFSSCIGRNLSFGNGKDWIPPDFDPKKTTLLIENPSKRVGEKMKAYMQAKYPYSFEIMGNNAIVGPDAKFQDLSIYRFALIETSYTLNSMYMSRPPTTAKDFYFLDRLTGKQYPPTRKGSSTTMMVFKPIINTIVKYFQ